MKIYLRDDDILVASSSGWEDLFGRFKQVHEWTKESEGKLIHVCSILTDDIQLYPEAISYMKDEIAAGCILPELHGKKHIDYGKLSKDQVNEHLKISRDYIFNTFDYQITKWYTPWGASAPHLHECAMENNIKLVDCSNLIQLKGSESILSALKSGEPIETYNEVEVFTHFWEKGARIKRLAIVLKYGSWNDAEKADSKLFK